MASAKNNNSASDSTGGFKTVAFGFDKNDVTMYIASLRKKMKQMEEDFQLKLTEALENPSASNEALKHEREVIRAEMESLWGQKLSERNQILKQQQNQIDDLEDDVHQKDKIIEALKAQLSAVNSAGEGGGDGSEMNAKAAKAYVQLTSDLRTVTLSLQNTLSKIEKTWRGEFEEEISQIEIQEAQKQQVYAAQAIAPNVYAQPPVPVAVVKEEAAPSPAPAAPAIDKQEAAANSVAVKEETAPAPVAAAPSANKQESAPVSETVDSAAASETKTDAAKESSKKKSGDSKKQSKTKSKAAPPPQPVKLPPMEAFDFGDEEDDPFKGLLANLSDEVSSVPVKPAESEPAAEAAGNAAKTEQASPKSEQTAPTTEQAAPKTEQEAPKPQQPAAEVEQAPAFVPAKEEELNAFEGIDNLLLADDNGDNASTPAPEPYNDFGDLGDLLAEPMPDTAKKAVTNKPSNTNTQPVAEPKIEIDDDLSALLADEPAVFAPEDIKPAETVVAATDDFADILAQNSAAEKPGFGEGLLIADENAAADKGMDLDASLLSDIVISPGDNNGDLDKMLKEQEAKEYAQFGDLFISPADEEDVISFTGIKTESSENTANTINTENNFPAPKAEPTKKAEKKEDDLFDFSFLATDSDDEDDMSTDASFNGML